MVIRVRGIEIDCKRRVIAHGGVEVAIPDRGFRRWSVLLSLLLGGGLTVEELFDMTYGHYLNGGPDGGPAGMRIFIHQPFMRAIYTRLGLRLHITRSCERINRYELIPAYMDRGSR